MREDIMNIQKQKKDVSASIKSSAKKSVKKDKNNIEIGERLKTIRKGRGETQEQLAEKMGLCQITISKIETGAITLTLPNLLKIAEHYNVSLDYLCKDTGNATDLDILKKYIDLAYKNLGMGDSEHFNYPEFAINRAFFDYLIQSYHAHNSIAPSDVIDTWCKKAMDNFFKQKESDETISFVPLPPSFLSSDDAIDWKQTDLIREIDNYFRNIMKKK